MPRAYLDELLNAELSAREERRIRTALKLSNLTTGQTLADFDFAFQPAIERSKVETLATGAWIRAAETKTLHDRSELLAGDEILTTGILDRCCTGRTYSISRAAVTGSAIWSRRSALYRPNPRATASEDPGTA